MEINVEIWNLKMKCTPYGLHGQAALKIAKAYLFFEVGLGGDTLTHEGEALKVHIRLHGGKIYMESYIIDYE